MLNFANKLGIVGLACPFKDNNSLPPRIDT